MKHVFLVGILVSLFAGLFCEAADPKFSSEPAEQRPRVVVVREPEATRAFVPAWDKILPMMERGLTRLTGKTNVAQAWLSLVSTNDVIGIKVHSTPGGQSGTRPAVVDAVIKSLLEGGISPQRIIIWDRQLVHLRLAGFYDIAEKYKVRIQSAAQAGFDGAVFYENSILGEPVWGDFEFGKKGEGVGRRSYVSRLVTKEITKIINVTPMLNHPFAGVAGNLYSVALGSVDNAIRFENNTERLAVAVPEIYALPELFEHVALNITDALICQYEGEQRSLLHYSVPLNELRFSKDAVALDTLSVLEIRRQSQLAKMPERKPNMDLYQNAALLELGVSDEKKISVEIVKQ